MNPPGLETLLATPESVVVLAALLCLGSLLAGYRWGRQNGLQEGELRGMTRAPVELHHQALERGVCPTCGSRAASMALKRDGEGEEGLPSNSSY